MKKTIFVLIFILFNNFLFSQNLVKDIKYHPGFDSTLAPFYHGVASGDATDTSVIIWTKTTPEILMRSISINWLVATDSLMKNIVQQGKMQALPENDYCIKIDVKNLSPNTFYYYQFINSDKKSVIGRTKTLPDKSDNYSLFRPVFFTGSNYNAGYFNAYKNICNRTDIDAVYHLGDYFYEYGTNTYGNNKNRPLMPPYEVVSLQDYRTRFSHYRLDPDLREAHRLYCWYVIWDDHETADNSWTGGALNHQPNEGNWNVRKNAAKKAYFEWMPIKENKDSSIFSTFSVGKLARFILLDTRLQGRDFQGTDPYDTTKTMLGKPQLHWLFAQLLKAKKDSVNWIFITQQVMFAPFKIANKIVNPDQWDGYEFERQEIIDFIKNNNFTNVVIISGDVHTSWANEIYFNNKKDSIVIPEFITPSITSPSISKFPAFFAKLFIKTTMPHVKYVNLTKKGYMILNIIPSSITAEWYFLRTIKTPNTSIKSQHFVKIQKPDLKIQKVK